MDPQSVNEEKKEKKQQQVMLAPNTRDYYIDPTSGGIRRIECRGTTKAELKAEKKAARKEKIRRLKKLKNRS